MSNRAFLASQLATARTHTDNLSSWERESIRQTIQGRSTQAPAQNDRNETTSRTRNSGRR